MERGAGEILLTSMDRDGTEDGYELDLTRAVAEAVDVPVIASGGAGHLDHLVEAIVEPVTSARLPFGKIVTPLPRSIPGTVYTRAVQSTVSTTETLFVSMP